MSNSVIHAFFLGRAAAQAINRQLEDALTNALSELGKFDAEQRDRLRQFTDQVIESANREAGAAADSTISNTGSNTGKTGSKPADLQAMIDELRAEIASLRTELKNYRKQS
ncbi:MULTISPECIES: DUF6825 family protein [Moorena]|uniref:Thylakoid lumen protein n=1 Tax=Moorena producens 3L TaxID=489825 RepID=F4XMK7_9CYAN|nr:MULTISPECIES: hypothetical protein [Moorena]EGJ33916.1 hypothetical protein LYNGBM3L_20170 [Moorena producens 3L]NEP32056.1 hypothetical protein [Moorena sp. SIO3B2]NEP69573.1 hypothetical protein [Moorena sp. SIO3A5]OLT64922.1 hypothetical protein BI334_07665 [Moorena producens 3L]